MSKNLLIVIVLILGVTILFAGVIKVRKTNSVVTTEELQWPNYEEEEEKEEEIQEEEIAEEPTSYEEALKIAKAKKKKVLLFFTADWCRYCQEMKKTTLKNEDVQAAIKRYVYYVVDTDYERELATKYSVSGIPAFRIVTDSEEVKKKASGYMSVKTFLKWLEGEAVPS